MKVIKQPDTNWSTQHTYIHCEAVLEVEKSDVKSVYHEGDYRDPDYFSYSANCSVCGFSFNILSTLIPKAVQLEIQKKSGK